MTAPVTSDANFISTYFINNSTEIDDCSLLLNSLSNYAYESFPVFSSGTGTDIYNETSNNAYLLEKVKRRHFTMQNRLLGKKGYELTNHLGNVLAVISDRKIQVQNTSNTSLVDYFLPDVISMTDYYAFGSMMPGRNLNSNNYPFGYQSSLKDDEISGNGNTYSTYFRELDVRLGRWFAIDPKTSLTPWESPYVSMGDNPISNNDLLGDIFNRLFGSSKEQRKAAKQLAKSSHGRIHHKWKRDIHVTWENNNDSRNLGNLIGRFDTKLEYSDGVTIRPEDQYFSQGGQKITHIAQQREAAEYRNLSFTAKCTRAFTVNDNSDYQGYAAVNLDFDKGMNILTSEISLFTGGSVYFIKGASIGAKIYATLNVVDAVDDISGLGKKMVNGNKTASAIYFGSKAVLSFTDKTFTSLEVANGANSALNYISLLNNEYKTIDNTIKAIQKDTK